jgi:hypothetical protein
VDSAGGYLHLNSACSILQPGQNERESIAKTVRVQHGEGAPMKAVVLHEYKEPLTVEEIEIAES